MYIFYSNTTLHNECRRKTVFLPLNPSDNRHIGVVAEERFLPGVCAGGRGRLRVENVRGPALVALVDHTARNDLREQRAK